MYSEFVATLAGIQPISDLVRAEFLPKLKITKAQKGKLLLSDGDICDRLWFVKSGLVRGYQLIENQERGCEEVTEWFAKENNFFYAVESFVNQIPTREYIEVLEPSMFISISRQDLYQLYLDHPEICCLGRIIAERALLAHKELLRDMRMLSAPQKFEAFRARSKELFARLPQKYIASYLGISENYVSKLKAKY